MIRKLTAGFDSLMKNYTPDPYVYALLLTFLVFILGVVVADSSVLDLAHTWGKGFWALSTFTLQMTMILFLGYVVALSPPIKKGLSYLAGLPQTLPQAAVYTTILSLVGALLNWGFGLIISALYCKELGKKFKGRKFAVLVACSYSGFLVWHGGLSGSIPLVVSTPGNFSEATLGRLVPLNETIFSMLNLGIVAAHFVLLPILSYFLVKTNSDEHEAYIAEDFHLPVANEPRTTAEVWENSFLLTALPGAIFVLYIVWQVLDGSFTVDLNQINLFLFVLAMIMHRTPRAFLDACFGASQKVWPILVQFPFYAGIMAIMQESGLAAIMSNKFVEIATKETLPVLVYLSAGLVNIFIPSGGGQWAVQGPMVIEAAKELGANVNASMMAVAWGDAWTNMIQPFWALPLLAIAGLKAKDIMSSLVYVFLLSGFITVICFLVFV
jgi:short-chain fatty acids transporter